MSKNKNTFQFITFDKLLSKDIVIKKTPKLKPEDESYLKECFERWNTPNSSLEFSDLRKSLGTKIMTLDLMLNNIDEVISILFEYLEKASSLSFYIMLDMLQSLVCDIREDIIPYLPRVFDVISKLINNQKKDAECAELINKTFSCIAHIIFYLERPLIKDGKISEILPLIKSLLFHKTKPFVRKFMAQAIGHVIRKVPDFPSFFNNIILGVLVDEYTSNHADAIGKLMSNCLKIEERLLSSAPKLFLSYFDILYSRDSDVEFFISCFDEMFKDLLTSIDENSYKQLWQLMVDKLSNSEGEQPDELELLTIELFFKSAQNKKLSACSKLFTEKVKRLVSSSPSNKVLEISKLLIDKMPVDQDILNLIQTIIISKELDMTKRFEFIKFYITNEHFEQAIKNSLSNFLSSFVTKEWLSVSQDNLHTVLYGMSDLINTKFPISKQSSWKEHLASSSVNFNFFFLNNDNTALIKALKRIVKGQIVSKELFWMTMIVLPHIYPANTDETFIVELNRIVNNMSNSEYDANTLFATSCILDCMALLSVIQGADPRITINTEKLLSLLPNQSFTSPIEPIIMEILFKYTAIDSNNQIVKQHQHTFVNKLKSPSHKTRLSALEIIKSTLCSDIPIYCQQIEELLELNETEIAKKEKTIFRLMDHIRFTETMSELEKKIIISYLLGILHINFTSLWKYIMKILYTFYPVNKEEKKYCKEVTDANEVIIWVNVCAQFDVCAQYLASDIEEESVSFEYCCALQEKYVLEKFYNGRTVDWLTYRLNLIKIMTQFPELAGRKSSVLSPLLLSVYCDEVRAHKEKMKIRKDTLLSLMYLYSKIPNITCTYNEAKCRQMFYKCLSSNKPEEQKAAFLVLLNYKMPELMSYKDRILLILEKSQDDKKEISLSEIIPSHRNVVVPIFLRIIFGKLKRAGSSKKQKPLIRCLIDLEKCEMGLLLKLLMESLRQSDNVYDIVNSNETIEDISSSVKTLVGENYWSYGLLTTMLGVTSTMQALITGLVNKMSDDLLTSVLTVVLDLYDCCTIVKNKQVTVMETNDNENDPKIENVGAVVKQIRKKCADIILFYFSKIEYYQWSEVTLQRVFESIVTPQLAKLAAENITSFNTTIQLSVLWSDNDKWIHLITPEMFVSYANLLLNRKLDRLEVGNKLVHVVYNVMERIEKNEICKNMVFGNIGKLIEYLGRRVTAMRPYYRSKLNDEDQKVLQKELKMVKICVDLLVEARWEAEHAETIKKMINNVLVLLYNSNPLNHFVVTSLIRVDTQIDDDHNEMSKETIEVGFLRAVESLMCACGCDPSVMMYLERLLTLQSRLKRRASRTVLSQAIANILKVVTLPEYGHGEINVSLGNIVESLNSWNELRLEDMNYDAITSAISTVGECLRARPCKDVINCESLYPSTSIHTSLWLYHATAQNCLYLMSQVDLLRDVASLFLQQLFQSLAETNNEKVQRSMFFDHIWPFIARSISTKDQMCHFAFVKLLQTVLINFGCNARFVDVARLARNEVEEKNFFDEMLSFTDEDLTKGLRKLVKFLRNHEVSDINLREIIRPIVFFRLSMMDVKSHTERQRASIKVSKKEYTDACMEAVTALSKRCSPELYKVLVEEQMAKLDKGTDVETSISVLVSIMEGYHLTDKDNNDFMKQVIRSLETHLARKDPSADKHKKSQSSQNDVLNTKDAEWTVKGVYLQVPIARALVNIAIKLPKEFMKQQVTRVILRLCEFLKSNDISVRKITGDTMVEILLRLNKNDENKLEHGVVRFLNFTVQSIRSQLNRGFQRHVGLFTCHKIIEKLVKEKVFDIQSMETSTMTTLLEMYLDEQFGEMAKEKAERHDAEKGMISEAASDKAYNGVLALATIVSENDLLELVRKIIEAAKEMRSQKSLNKMQTIIDNLRNGLIKNNRLDAGKLLALAMVHLNENLDFLFSKSLQPGNANLRMIKPSKQPGEDMHLYQRPERLDGYTEKVAGKMIDNWSYLIVRFGLTLLNSLIKITKGNNIKNIDLRSVLDQVVDRILIILTNVHHKDMLIAAIKSLKDIVEIDPPRLAARVKDVEALLFKLHDTNSYFRDDKDPSSLIFYKTMTLFLQRRDITLSHNQYKVLLFGIDLDSDKSIMNSVYLLKAIINKRINEPHSRQTAVIHLKEELDLQLVDIVAKVRGIALTGESESTRTEARSAVMCFIEHYKNKDWNYINDTVVYYAKGLMGYNSEMGSVSACDMIQQILTAYPGVMTYDGMTKKRLIAAARFAMIRGATEKVVRTMSCISMQMMALLSDEDQGEIHEFIMSMISTGEGVDIGIYVFLMAQVLGAVKGERMVNWSLKLVDLITKRFPIMVDQCNQLSDQIKALSGEDASMMKDIEGNVDVKDKLINERSDIIANMDRFLYSIGHLLDIDHENMDQVQVKRYLMDTGTSNNLWIIIVTKLLCQQYSANMRLNAARLVIQPLLKFQLDYEHKDSSMFSSEFVHQLTEETFSQLANNDVMDSECDVVLMNLVLLWRLVLETLTGGNCTAALRKILDRANKVSNNELDENQTVVRRCVIVKFLAAIVAKTSVADMDAMDLVKNVVWMWMREDRQMKNGKKNKKLKEIPAKDVREWSQLVISLGKLMEANYGETLQTLKTTFTTERSILKRKTIETNAALAVSDPCKAITAAKRRKTVKK